ncbi:MAG: lipoyl(octanoyl) transferase LipB [Rhodothermales bacterium]|nr:lipoyl(octanoyl) transferase LipB [Rhodothermales bacterium]MBO6779181.1 lipoyl(octanoyl) transferase LipB [Rhodothermales bacterium]
MAARDSSGHARQEVVVCRLGVLQYQPTWDLQRRIQSRLIAAKRSEPTEHLPHVMLLLEHPPVYTLGKSGSRENLLWDDARLAEQGVEFHHIDRGGDITFHGPGQLVGYPILDLDRFFTDIHRYLRELEDAVIHTLAQVGIEGDRVDGRTGVWVGPDVRGPERKVCAMGVRCSRWVTMHGFALNVQPRMDFYDGIVPCGIDDRGVTSMALEHGRPIEMNQVMGWFEQGFARQFDCDVRVLEGPFAWAFLSRFLEAEMSAESYQAPRE